MEATQTQAVSVLTPAIVGEMVARHMRPGITLRRVIIGATGETAKVFLDGVSGRGAPKTAGVALFASTNGYAFFYGNTVASATFTDPQWSAWFASQVA